MDSQNNKERIQYLAAKLKNGTITLEEREEFESWYNSYEDSSVIVDAEDDIHTVKERIYSSVEQQTIRSKEGGTFLKSGWFQIAATLLICAIAVWLYTGRLGTQPNPLNTANLQKILPGGEKALLILSDGSKVVLDDKANRSMINIEGADIKRGKGQLVYASSGDSKGKPVFHTIQTPKGGTYGLTLPDGTKVWLNAASSLKYPVDFVGEYREVELVGEAYFEVSKDALRPFIVKNSKLNIEVLGTHFNVNAYADNREIKTTLFEGKVKLVRENEDIILKPMQQSVLNASTSIMKVRSIDSDEAISWKNGEFVFDNELITSVMKKISRWYDVEVVYQGAIPDYEYVGTISRDKDISSVLKMLSLTNTIRFKIDGRRIIVMK